MFGGDYDNPRKSSEDVRYGKSARTGSGSVYLRLCSDILNFKGACVVKPNKFLSQVIVA